MAWYGLVRRTVKTFNVTIKGVSPLLINRFTEAAEQSRPTRRITAIRKDPREEARSAAYIAEDGTFYFNAFSIPACMGNAGSSHKQTGTRKTLRFVVPSAVRTLIEGITILDGESPAKDFEVDSRPVTIPATKGRIMRHRPRFDRWNANFDLVIDDNLLDPDMALQLLTEAGVSYGIGDFRPEKRGPFGTFLVTSWQEIADGIKVGDDVIEI
jgi:hypothetical protein